MANWLQCIKRNFWTEILTLLILSQVSVEVISQTAVFRWWMYLLYILENARTSSFLLQYLHVARFAFFFHFAFILFVQKQEFIWSQSFEYFRIDHVFFSNQITIVFWLRSKICILFSFCFYALCSKTGFAFFLHFSKTARFAFFFH